ncbi:lipoyl domain-containing protein [Komagataeibacter sp. FNDCR2]|uniref:lipoyl domain-containing protein n=1 Tax=Komagataeibacter sp. FNDCR2 TaxID=2878682 RepID=UPI001E52ACFF|nr:lipoyl domain-containing protein [Komagataeibacter sp. FNDCR2]MCE2574219.1 lipoyl domain-containing protein [Komagataeibacter sp. FNDCR2]
MIYQLSVPAAVPGVEEIRILEWHGEPGTAFETGDLIVELETHKAVVEVRAGQPGVLRVIDAQPGDWLGIGLRLALFTDTADEALPEGRAPVADIPVDFAVI